MFFLFSCMCISSSSSSKWIWISGNNFVTPDTWHDVCLFLKQVDKDNLLFMYLQYLQFVCFREFLQMMTSRSHPKVNVDRCWRYPWPLLHVMSRFLSCGRVLAASLKSEWCGGCGGWGWDCLAPGPAQRMLHGFQQHGNFTSVPTWIFSCTHE